MDAKEAYEIIRKSDSITAALYPQVTRALAYLEALSGPEVKVLIEALEKYKGFALESTFYADDALAKFKSVTGDK